jgi:two-component system, NtrC family, sensor histidine kinase HydH
MKNLSRDQFAALLGGLPHAVQTGIIVTSAEGDLLFASDAAIAMLGHESQDSLEENWEEDASPLIAILDKQSRASATVRAPRSDEQLEVRIDYLDSDDCTGSICFVKNRRSHEAFHEALRQAGRCANRSEILSTTLHDVRTPMTALLGSADLLCETLDSELEPNRALRDRQLQSAVQMKRELERLCDLVQRIVREVDADVNASKSDVELRSLIFDVVSALNDAAARRKVNITVSLGRTPVVLYGSRSRLRQVLLDLFVNALHAMEDEGGELRVTLDLLDDCVRLSVEDDGVGVASEVRSSLFEPYVTTKEKGIGLGLYLVKETISNIGGEISYESTEGRGTRFELELPLKEKQS